MLRHKQVALKNASVGEQTASLCLKCNYVVDIVWCTSPS